MCKQLDLSAYHAGECVHGVHGKENCHVCTPRDPEPKMRWDNIPGLTIALDPPKRRKIKQNYP